MKIFNRQTGNLAEDIAARKLLHEGYEILERNFANKFGEIDIIARDGGTLVFVEVKAKVGEGFGSPEEMVTTGKLRKIRNMAAVYLEGRLETCRIDVIAVVLTNENEVVRLTHYVNVV